MLTTQFKKILSERLREEKPLVQVLIGPRQVGKTTAAEQIYNEWSGPKSMVSADSPTPPKAEWIRFHWEQARLKGPSTLLVIDEVQKVTGWSEQIKILFDRDRATGKMKILLLGSSSLYLQKGLQESLAGRFELIHAPHWSFRDCTEAFGWDFETYLKFGGYPGAVPFIHEEARWRSYILQSIIEPVLGRDILGQHPVGKPALFRQTFEMVVQYPAQIVSLQKLLGQLQDRGNAETVRHYLDLLEKSFLILTLQKYSGSVLATRASIPKIVVLNPALTHAYQPLSRLKEDPVWYGQHFESVIGAHLSRIPDSRLYYWREGRDEVDYILKTADGIRAIEIKSGLRHSKGRGLEKFSRLYPRARCEIWDFDRCLSFLTGDIPPSDPISFS